MSLATPKAIRSLQRGLYVKAKEEPGYRFYSLYDKIRRPDILEFAYRLAKANGGAPGVDGETFEKIESGSRSSWLAELREDLRSRRYKPDAVRRVYIPKPGGGERPLGIPTVRDRVAQTAALLVIEPIFEAELADEMYGYRPKRSAQGAIAAVHQALRAGYTDVVDADLSKYFDTIPHSALLRSVARRISDGAVLHLIRLWLKSPIEETDDAGRTRRTGGRGLTKGTPQGGVISPLLANIFMNRFLRAWRERGMERRLSAKVVNYADDFVILCRRSADLQGAVQALDVTRRWMTSLELTLNEKKTRLCNAWETTFDFLGYTFGRTVFKPTGRTYLTARPSKKAMARLRDRVRVILVSRNKAPWPAVATQLERSVRGWKNYFSYGDTAHAYWDLDRFLSERARRFLAKRHKLSGQGSRMFSLDQLYGSLGLIRLGPPPRAVRLNARRETSPRAVCGKTARTVR